MKNLKEIISQLDTVTPCVLNPLFLRHKSSGPFACIHPSDHQVADEKGCYGHANNVYYGRNPLRQQRGEQVISHLHEDEIDTDKCRRSWMPLLKDRRRRYFELLYAD